MEAQRARGRTIHFKSSGQIDRERATPLADDIIFRIQSMTKPPIPASASAWVSP